MFIPPKAVVLAEGDKVIKLKTAFPPMA